MAKTVRSYKELKKNDAYELLYEEYLEDIKSSGIVLRHKKSGARICVMSSEDNNKMFCAAFRTPPSDSTGVPHIIEHSVLNGSKHFPSRDPFMQLIKGSLNTFVNAMTYPDKTLYPVASCNDKDFANLMHVYMDAVFYPNIYSRPQIFLQEGWHYEMNDREDELKINGVVYSEMKGAMSSPDRAIWDVINKYMFPDTTYGVNSGGDPEVIPQLSYEQFLDFHSRLYHPANSYIFLYGDCDMDERLDWMDKNYLSDFDVIEPHSQVQNQKHLGSFEPLRVLETYPVGSEDTTEGKDFLAFSVMGGSNLDVLECRAWAVLSEVLLNADSAPLKKALREAGIGEDVYGGYESHAIEDVFTIIAKNARAEDVDRFYSIIMDTLKKQVEEGVNEKAILATINRSEFRFREADYGGFPRGLDYASNMLQSWLYDDGAAFSYMHVLTDMAELKKRIGTGYYEDLIKKVFFETDHAVLLTMVPEQGMNDRKNQELKEKLAAYKASLSAEEIDAIVKSTADLRAYQSREATAEELNCIPSLTRNDIPRETTPFYNEERTVGGAKTVYHAIETGGITIANLFFDLPALPGEYVPYVNILSALLCRLNTAEHSYEELDVDMKLNVGSLAFAPNVIRTHGSMDDCRKFYGIYIRALSNQVDYAVKTALEIVTSTDFADTDRIKTLLAEMKNDKKQEIVNSGHAVSMARARSYYSQLECFYQNLTGIDFYLFLCDLLDNWEARKAEVSDRLSALTRAIFDPDHMIISLAADEAGCLALDKALPPFIAGLKKLERSSLGEEVRYVPEKKNEGILIPSQVQYVGRAGNLRFAGIPYSGAYQVVKTAVNSDWLYQQVRVKGGAYGVGCVFGGESGNVQFYSYRDPKLAETDAVYKNTGDFVRNHKFDEKELTRYIIGTFSAYERPLSNYNKASRSFEAYISGRTYEDVLKERAEMLDITAEEFASVAAAFEAVCDQGYFCVVGNETKLRENKDLFGTLVEIR